MKPVQWLCETIWCSGLSFTIILFGYLIGTAILRAPFETAADGLHWVVGCGLLVVAIGILVLTRPVLIRDDWASSGRGHESADAEAV